MSTESEKNNSPATSVNPSLQPKKRVRYILPQGAVIGGVYQVEKPLGHGGMGEVYLARHTKLDIFRAVKILLPKIAASNPMFATHFMQEARLAIQIQHPNIINVMDANHDERLNIYYIVMELVDGASIRNLIKKDGPFTEQKTLEIALYVGKALEEADKKHIVHRDIKPDNIMLTKEGKVKLADLGIAKSPADSMSSDQDAQNVLIGTPAYVSPEQAKNAEDVDCRADIYSLGVSLYEMLAGEKPYKGATTIETLGKMLNSPVPDVREKNRNVSRETAKLIQKMMSKDRDERPRNWTRFCDEVEGILGRTMSIRVIDDINEGTQSTAAEINRERVAAGGIVLSDNMSGPKSIKPKLKKIMRVLIPSVIGFALCMLFMSGVLSVDNLHHYKREFILFCMGDDYKKLCDRDGLNPPWSMAFAGSLEKQAWYNQNKPVVPPPPPIPVPVPSDSNIKEPKPVNEYDGNGTLKFSLSATPTPDVEEYLKDKKLTISSNDEKIKEMFVVLPGNLEAPAGKYKLQMSLPGCKALKEVEFELKKDETQEIKIDAIPLNGTIQIKCNVPQFKVWQNQQWIPAEKIPAGKISVESLKYVEVSVKADGYKTYKSPDKIRLLPNETRDLDVKLEKLRSTDDDNTENLKSAEKEYLEEHYARAKILYEIDAKNGNPIANFRLGEINENGYGLWMADKKEAYRYYLAAAEQDYDKAIFKVGYFYENGIGGVPQSDVKALKWYRLGAELENVQCLNKIAEFYEKGRGEVAADTEKAIDYYKRGAAKGDSDAQFNLGRIYEQKMLHATAQRDKDQFRQMARDWYDKAARQGNDEAKKRMNSL